MGAPARTSVADLVFVEIAAGHDLRIGEAGFVEDGAHLARERDRDRRYRGARPTAACQASRRCGRPRGYRRYRASCTVARRACFAACGRLRVSQANDITQECAEVPEHGNAVTESGERVAGARAAPDIGGARAEDSGFGRVRAARAEFDDAPAFGGFDAARGFARDESRKGHRRQKISFGNLRFDDGRTHGQERLAGEEGRAFGHGEQVAGEAEVGAGNRRIPRELVGTERARADTSISSSVNERLRRYSTACGRPAARQ